MSSYLKFLSRNKLYTAIEAVGLIVSIAFVILIGTVKDYMILVGIAALIGIPLAIWFCGRYLDRFAYRIEHYGWIVVVAVILGVLMAFLSVLWQTLKAARTNPAEALKKE